MSVLYEEQRESNEAVAVWTVWLHIPEFDDLDEQDFYWATGQGIELEDGNVYTQQLTQVPRGRHQKDRGNDYAEFTISNVDYAIYQEILPYQNILEKAEVVIRKCYEVSKDFWESEIIFVGYVKDFTLDDTDKTFKFTASSDMSRSGFLVGNRILTRERCGTEFNINGLISPTYHPCGWQTAQGGNPLFCSKFEKGVDGCEAHNNAHRFYAVPALSTADVEIIDGSGSGWNYGSGPCFSEKAFVVTGTIDAWGLMPINKVEVGMPHVGFDIFDNDKLINSTVLNTFSGISDQMWNAVFDKARFEVKKEHLFYLGKRVFTPVASLGSRPALGMDFQQNRVRSTLKSIKRLSELMSYYNLHTESNNYIVTDENGIYFYFVHNNKPLLPE